MQVPEPDPARRRQVVGAAIVDDLARPRQLLAARRTAPPELAGGWELPGGKVEDGEAPPVALHRELLEELGVQVELGDPVPGPLPDGAWPLGEHLGMLVWWARIVSGRPRPLEDHDALRRLPPGSWLDVAWLPADVPVVRRLQALAGQDRPVTGDDGRGVPPG